MHWQRWRKNGVLGGPDPTVSASDDPDERLKFHGWTVTDTGCWDWNGPREVAGYGTAKIGGKTYKTHRLAYETWVAPIPDGKYILHSCDNPPCINPDHLRTGTQRENVRDREVRGRSGRSKLTPRDVLAVRAAYLDRNVTQAMLAERYGVSIMTIGRVVRGESWSHV